MPDLTPTRPTSGTPIESTWGQSVHDAIEGIQAGTATPTLTASVAFDVPITFPRAYAVPPQVYPSIVGGNTNLAGLVSLPSTTGCSIRIFKRDGTTLTAGVVTLYWLAVGTPA